VSARFVRAEDAESYRDQGLWSRSETLQTVLAAHAARWPERPAAVDDSGGSITYGDLQDRSARMAAAFRQRGVKQGDVVGLQLPNRVEAAVISAAIEKAGAVVCPLVPAYRRSELTHIVRKTDMRALVVPGNYRGFDHEAMALQLADEAAGLRWVITLDKAHDDPRSTCFDHVDAGPADAGPFRNPQLDPDAVAAVLFTSGTESEPKGALHTHNTLSASTRTIIGLLDLGPGDNVFMASPVGHGTGYGFGIRLAAFLGSTLVLQERWDPGAAARLIAKYDVAYTHGSIPFVEDMVALKHLDSTTLPSLKYFVTGGAAIPPGTIKRVREKLGCDLLRLYGQTEGFMSTLTRVDDPLDKAEATDGRPVPGVQILVVDDAGRPTPSGQTGHGLYKGPHRCIDFLDDEERARKSLTDDGWFRSGDLVSLDADGYLVVAGRSKEVINRGGYKYSPREVEEALLCHPDVVRVAIVAVPDPRLVERSCAFLITRDDVPLTVEDLGRHLESLGIAVFKWPEQVKIVQEFPMTPSGKVQKFHLAESLARSTSAPQPPGP
jgi:non-ribosomal peptide synthetase component E (peptide arylation enzyme)